jgi:hypothetical protein
MTIAPAPVAASPVTGQPIATTRCLCSGHLAALLGPAAAVDAAHAAADRLDQLGETSR